MRAGVGMRGCACPPAAASEAQRGPVGTCGPGVLLMCFLVNVREKDADSRLTSGQFVVEGHCQSASPWVCLYCAIA